MRREAEAGCLFQSKGPNQQQLLAKAVSAGFHHRVIAKTVLEKELVCVETGGGKKPAIVITSGSHSCEWAGPLAAIRLLTRLKSEHQVHIVPCRDPLGYNGFITCMKQAIGAPLEAKDSDEIDL